MCDLIHCGEPTLKALEKFDVSRMYGSLRPAQGVGNSWGTGCDETHNWNGKARFQAPQANRNLNGTPRAVIKEPQSNWSKKIEAEKALARSSGNLYDFGARSDPYTLTRNNLSMFDEDRFRPYMDDADTCSSDGNSTITSAPESVGEHLAARLSHANNREVSVEHKPTNSSGNSSINISWIETPHDEVYQPEYGLDDESQLAQFAQSSVRVALDLHDPTGQYRQLLHSVKESCSKRKFMLKYLPNNTTPTQVKSWVTCLASINGVRLSSVAMPKGRSQGYATIVVEDEEDLTTMMRACNRKQVLIDGGCLRTLIGRENGRMRGVKTTRAVHYYSGETAKLHIQNLRTDFDIQTVSALVWSMFVPLGAEEVTILDRENKFKRKGGNLYRSCNIRILTSRYHDTNFLKSFFYNNQRVFQEWLGTQDSKVVLDLKRD